MKLNPHRHEDPEINLVPLIDVVLVLLIFFMVTTTFMRDAGLHVNLPQAGKAPPLSESQILEVEVDAGGHYFINGRQLRDNSPETLQQGIERIAGSDRQRPLVIRADGKASHQSVVTIMDVAGSLGFTQLSIATAADAKAAVAP